MVIGCITQGVIGLDDQGSLEEFEDFKSVSITAASMPGVIISPFRLALDELPEPVAPQAEWVRLFGNAAAEDEPVVITMADPSFAGLVQALRGMDTAFPTSPKVGVSAWPAATNGTPFPHRVFSSMPSKPLGIGAMLRQDPPGCILGVTLSGNVKMEVLVGTPGLRPLGPALRVNQAQDFTILRLGPVDAPSSHETAGEALTAP